MARETRNILSVWADFFSSLMGGTTTRIDPTERELEIDDVMTDRQIRDICRGEDAPFWGSVQEAQLKNRKLKAKFRKRGE